ncbi:MAG TPA: hypothetical protein VEJ63_07025 [Planctomycetota bacterium]|nr:hypothetical protein [Planctomycetota bacterium]
MSEADLEEIIRRAQRRVRVQHALRAALAALGVTLLIAATLIFCARWLALSSTWTVLPLVFVPLITAAVALCVFQRYRPQPSSIALRLDGLADTAEHLLTWWELRQRPDVELNDLQRGFKAAQRAAALKACEQMQPSRLLPLRTPSWSRALWLAVLFVLCALLMPERQIIAAAPVRTLASRTPVVEVSAGPGGSQEKAGAETPRVEPLSATEMFKLKFELSSGQLTPEQREKMLRELKTRIGDTPPTALPQELQDILNILEKDSVQKKDAAESNPASSSQKVGGEGETHRTGELPGIANVPEQLQKAFTRVREHYSDVQTELERYYSSTEPEERRP